MATKRGGADEAQRDRNHSPRTGDEEEDIETLEGEELDLDEFLDDEDANPGDRRRDPLRRP